MTAPVFPVRVLCHLVLGRMAAGALAVLVLLGLAWALPFPADSPARDWRNAAGLAPSIAAGARPSLWLERRAGAR